VSQVSGRRFSGLASPHQLLLVALLLLTIATAKGESCAFSIGPNGLCATLRLDPEAKVLRVGEAFWVRINVDGCSTSVGCPCADSALRTAQWRSEAPEIAVVDSTGRVVGRRPGSAAIVITPAAESSWRRTRVHVTVVP
jgi:hypothetical protein